MAWREKFLKVLRLVCCYLLSRIPYLLLGIAIGYLVLWLR